MKFLRRLFSVFVDPDLGRLYKLFLPYKWQIALACVFLMGGGKHVVPHGYALG